MYLFLQRLLLKSPVFLLLLFFAACQKDETFDPNSLSVGMIVVEGGSFNMGDDSMSDAPVHNVTVDGFYISEYEIDQKCYKDVMGKLPDLVTTVYGVGDSYPVYGLCWLDAVEFCNKLSIHDGLDSCYSVSGTMVTLNKNAFGYRLPTEAEWEFAARGGLKSKNYIYSGSNNLDEVAWYNTSGSYTPAIVLSQVGKKLPNELGLYDMSGNVAEFCWDWYGVDYYKVSEKLNPLGPATSSNGRRCLRGGSWAGFNTMAHVAKRAYRFPDPSVETATVQARFIAGGLRLVLPN